MYYSDGHQLNDDLKAAADEAALRDLAAHGADITRITPKPDGEYIAAGPGERWLAFGPSGTGGWDYAEYDGETLLCQDYAEDDEAMAAVIIAGQDEE